MVHGEPSTFYLMTVKASQPSLLPWFLIPEEFFEASSLEIGEIKEQRCCASLQLERLKGLEWRVKRKSIKRPDSFSNSTLPWHHRHGAENYFPSLKVNPRFTVVLSSIFSRYLRKFFHQIPDKSRGWNFRRYGTKTWKYLPIPYVNSNSAKTSNARRVDK